MLNYQRVHEYVKTSPGTSGAFLDAEPFKWCKSRRRSPGLSKSHVAEDVVTESMYFAHRWETLHLCIDHGEDVGKRKICEIEAVWKVNRTYGLWLFFLEIIQDDPRFLLEDVLEDAEGVLLHTAAALCISCLAAFCRLVDHRKSSWARKWTKPFLYLYNYIICNTYIITYIYCIYIYIYNYVYIIMYVCM